MTYPIKHLSVSSINLYYSCQWCWYHKYIKWQKPNMVHDYFEYGRKYHEEVHKYHTNKPHDDQLISPYTRKYPREYRKYSEIRFLQMLPGINLPILGFIDGNKGSVICDLKTGKSRPKMRNNPQVILYSQVYKLKKKTFPTFVFNWENGGNFKNLTTQSTDEEFEQLKEEKILPMLDAIKQPDKLELTGHTYAPHLFSQCPYL